MPRWTKLLLYKEFYQKSTVLLEAMWNFKSISLNYDYKYPLKDFYTILKRLKTESEK